jgi:hypothetical protein
MDKTTFSENIEDYLKDRLPTADKKAFEDAVASNPDYAAELRFNRDLFEATNEPEIEKLRSTMSQLAKEYASTMSEDSAASLDEGPGQPMLTAKVTKRWAWMAAAASFALLVSAYLLLRNPVTASGEALFAANFSAPLSIGTATRGDDGKYSSILDSIEIYYQAKDYRSVVHLTDLMLTTDTLSMDQKDQLWYNRGISQLCLQQGAAAEASLQNIYGPIMEQNKQWYIAYALLLQKDKQGAAKLAFEKIAAAPGTHPERRQKAGKIANSIPD